MPDTFTTVTTKGYGSRIMSSIQGVVLGFVLFAVSFGVLYWNEGRVDMSSIAKKSTEISSTTPSDGSANGTFVSTTGTVATTETLGDGLYLKPGAYLEVTRTPEMYAWTETKKEEKKSNTGGSETTTTTYTYKMEWTSKPMNSSSFNQPQGHTNPAMKSTASEAKASAVSVGTYTLDGKAVELPPVKALDLSADNVTVPDGGKISDNHLYLGYANPGAPVLGNERLSYSVLKSGFTGTVFGKAEGSNISRFTDEKGNSIYRVFDGDRSASLAQMHGEFVMALWLFRGLGFFMMWIGLGMILGPIGIILDFFPLLGSIGKTAISIVTFPVALVLSLITIVVSMLLHSVVALLIVLGLALAGIGYVVYRNKSKLPKMPSLGAMMSK
jgi:hypothetical protein